MNQLRLLWPLLLLLTGCISKVDVSATAKTAGNVQHAYVTINGLWLNTSENARADDTGWVGKEFVEPVTVDLAALNNGALITLASGIRLNAGSYHSLQLSLADNNELLTASADELGLTYNNEVQYLDGGGSLDTQPLELADPSGHIIVPVLIDIATATSGRNAFNQQTKTTVVTTAVTLDLDLLRGLTYFDYDGQPGVMLNAVIRASNDDTTGAISGSLDLSSVSSAQLDGSQGIVVTAEALSADGSRYEAIRNALITSAGSFTLASLPAADDATTYYHLVIHGPGIQAVVIADIPVTAGDITIVQNDALTLAAANSYQVNTGATASNHPANTQVQFYQTLPADSTPHLMEFAALDPFTGTFSEDIKLSTGKVVYGEYNDQNAITFTSVTPGEGVGKYLLGTHAALREMSDLTQSVTSTTANAVITLPSLPTSLITTNASAVTVAGTVTFTAGHYDAGMVLLTLGGQLLDVVDISSAIAGNHADFTFTEVAGHAAAARYEVSARLWKSSDPANTVVRVAADNAVDARSGDVTGVSITAP